jgi:hypothetical protein
MDRPDRPAALSAPAETRDLRANVSLRAQTPDEEPEFSWRAWAFESAQQIFLIAGIYILSIGPMYWHWYGARFAGGSQVLAGFYEPLRIAAELVPPFGAWMDWYVQLWIG